MAGTGANTAAEVWPCPNGTSVGIVFADIPLNLTGFTESDSPQFNFEVKMTHPAAYLPQHYGIGVTTLVIGGDGILHRVQSQLINPMTIEEQDSNYLVQADLAQWKGENITLRILVDDNQSPWALNALFSRFRLLNNGGTVQTYDDWAAGITEGFISNPDLQGILMEGPTHPEIRTELADHTMQNWMDGIASSEFDSSTVYFGSMGDTKGALWTWREGRQYTAAEVYPGPNGSVEGVAFVDITFDLTGYTQPVFSAYARMFTPDGIYSNGAGITLLVKDENGIFHKVQSKQIDNAIDKYGLVTADITGLLSILEVDHVTLRMIVDDNASPWGPGTELSFIQVVDGQDSGKRQGYNEWKAADALRTGFMSSEGLNALNLERNRVETDIMARHKNGFDPEVNVYSAIDSHRPLLGTHIYLNNSTREVLPYLDDVFDFAAHGDGEDGNVALDLVGSVPWIYVYQPAIPLGKSDTGRWNLQSFISGEIDEWANRYRYMLGVTMGSEPHTSPDYYYTGHTEAEIKNLGISGASAKEFGGWMGELYGTAAPGTPDANGHSFFSDFGYTADSWDELAINPAAPDFNYLQSIFREKAIQKAIKGTDANFATNTAGINYTSRLLSQYAYTPDYSSSMRQLQIPTRAVGVTYYPFNYENLVYGAGSSSKLVYSPAATEFRGSYIYQQALAKGLRVVYNEFCTNEGTDDGSGIAHNTPGNFYRGIFNELQYKPAVINWFAYMGSNDNQFAWFNLHPHENLMATLRNQLELGQVYDGIERGKRNLGVFLPVAQPEPVGGDYTGIAPGTSSGILEQILAPQLEKFGADVLLTNQLDKYDDYDNIIIVLGYIEGPTDAYLTDLLKNIPEGKKVMVLSASSELYCEPGQRSSADFRRSLTEVLPVSPDGNGSSGARDENVAVDGLNSTLRLTVASNTATSAEAAATGTVYEGSNGKNVAWKSNDSSLMVLAGIPTAGLDEEITGFFGITPSEMREAGTLKILNRGVTGAAATKAGWYSVDMGQTLTIGEGLVGYDLVSRQSVASGGTVTGETVVRVLDKNGFYVVDAGVGNVQLVSSGPGEVVVKAKKANFPSFTDTDKSEFVMYSPVLPTAEYEGQPQILTDMGGGFYSLSITNAERGTYSFEADISAPAAYTVSFNSNGGSAVQSQTVQTGGTATRPDAPTRTGYTFDGWYTDANWTTLFDFAAAITANVTLYAKWTSSGGGGGTTPATQPPVYPGAVVSGSASGVTLPVNVDTKTGTARVNLGESAKDILAGKEIPVITVPSIPGVNSYNLGIPASYLSESQKEGILTFSTGAGNITIPGNMLEGTEGANGKEIGITIGQGDKSQLPDNIKQALGDKPLVQLSMTVDGKQTEWNNPDAPVTVSIPYTPSAQELADPEHITIWYIDGKGNIVEVPSGKYDPVTGMVTFTTTHFSHYAVAFVKKTFDDLDGVSWAKKPIEVLASKGIMKEISGKEYAPKENITRADFLCFLIRTLSADARADESFDDISQDAYYYKEIGIAKKLGITNGTGNNKFSPDESITRQDMMVLTWRALKILKKTEQQGSSPDLEKFADQSLISAYAKDSVASVVKEGLIVGNAGQVNPVGSTTRAEAAVFLHRIYNKY